MNERIQELAYQAEEYADTMVDGGSEFHPVFVRKFAELLIDECIRLVGGYTKENEFGTDVKVAYEEITKHFGVE